MNVEHHEIRYGNSDFHVNQTYQVRDYDIVQEHSVICTELEYIGCQVQERQGQKGHASEIRQPVGFYPEDTEESIQGA